MLKSLFAVGHFIRKKIIITLEILYIDFDNTGENLRLITIEKKNLTRTHEVAGHIFISIPAKISSLKHN